MNGQADLNLCWVHMSEGMFSDTEAHMCYSVSGSAGFS